MEVRVNHTSAAAKFATAMRNGARRIFALILVILLAYYFIRDTSEPVSCPGPTCDARQPPTEPQTGSDLRTAPLADTQEMGEGLQHLAGFKIEIDLPRRVRAFQTRTSKSRWCNHNKQEIKVEGNEAVNNWNIIVSSKDLAVPRIRAMIQELRHQYFSLDRELRRPISWVTTFSSPSKWGREDLRPDILTMAKSVTRNVDQSRRLLQECFYSSKGMKERALKLLELAESQQECLLAVRDRLEVCGLFSCSKGPDWHKADSQIKEWYEFGVLLESVYNIAVTVSALVLIKAA
ncbi:hypothetical protein M407DRAFT_10755 [Tulasnella calospora MUT 4182]|uniref:Uncharacterized protein n=1 Tax=Tulasnella calospora MUT 4182 TaxID=1051891 RepID=A0A0C3PZ32_9AGAM|nr:hypothetical protein M407DRAFT_10755 [Tulasnella calospora MUT 4182]